MLPIVISAIESVEDRDLMTQFYISYKALMFSEARKHLDIEEDIEDVVYEALTRIIDKMDVFRELAPKQRLRYALKGRVSSLQFLLMISIRQFLKMCRKD